MLNASTASRGEANVPLALRCIDNLCVRVERQRVRECAVEFVRTADLYGPPRRYVMGYFSAVSEGTMALGGDLGG